MDQDFPATALAALGRLQTQIIAISEMEIINGEELEYRLWFCRMVRNAKRMLSYLVQFITPFEFDTFVGMVQEYHNTKEETKSRLRVVDNLPISPRQRRTLFKRMRMKVILNFTTQIVRETTLSVLNWRNAYEALNQGPLQLGNEEDSTQEL